MAQNTSVKMNNLTTEKTQKDQKLCQQLSRRSLHTAGNWKFRTDETKVNNIGSLNITICI